MHKTKIILTLSCLLLIGFATTALARHGKQDSSQEEKEALGKILYFDENLSINQNQSCASCHMPPSYVDPDNDLPVSEGSNTGDFGGRNAPSVAYAMGSPEFSYVEGLGYVGGQFWDGRANGLIAQAKGPFLNPVEMAMPDKAAVVAAIKANLSQYQELFSAVYDVDIAVLNLNSQREVTAVFNDVADAIAAYESSAEVNTFNSRYDAYLAGTALADNEEAGRTLFADHCSQCHPMKDPVTAHQKTMPTVLSSFTYHNLGLPHNDKIDVLQDKINLPDPGLGGRTDLFATEADALLEFGKFKTPTLRNIALTAPYGHNGYFADLTTMVQFLNNRDAFDQAEVPDNVTNKVGNLGLSGDEVDKIVAFLETLSDQ